MSNPNHNAVSALTAVLTMAAEGGNPHEVEVESMVALPYGKFNSVGYLVTIRNSSPYFVDPNEKVRRLDIPSHAFMDGELEVDFRMVGGFAGFDDTLRLSEHDGTLTINDAAELWELIDLVGFEADKGSGEPPHPDGFTYTITVGTGRRHRTVVAAESADRELLERLAPLIDWLTARTSSRFPKPALD
ncbi:protealysin inhibitor emfourin [Arthrobacter sp.]|uniref:protealysin inhibitor emfourin n=1 Tax=Arthrobacter sp. TaxID=1667 RepID=UPI0026DF570B|nr:protealysin inhibitor emfourin [Arthrobacter sp.]MDO5752664.1 hypothetical protein [Arthrobacter sp.]